MKKHIIAAALAALSAQAYSADFYVVVPVKNRTATIGNIQVTLNASQLPAALAGRAYAGFDFTSLLQVKGDPNFNAAGVSWSVAGGVLPVGMALSRDGKLSGTPASGGIAKFQLLASYKTKAGQQGYELVVGELTVALAPASLPLGVQGAAYHYDLKPHLTVAGEATPNAAAVTWSHTGTLPAGIRLNADGTLTGTPTAEGTYPVTITASYETATGQRTYQVAVGAITVSLAAAALPPGVQGAAYAFDFKPHLSVGGDAAYTGAGATWSLASGSLPPGLVLNANGTITGMPTAEGPHPFTVKAVYKTKSGEQAYQVIVGAITVALASASLPEITVDNSYTYDMKPKLTVTGDAAYASDGAGAAWSIASGSLPAGLNVNATTGIITGTPSAVGTQAFKAKVSYKGKQAEQDYSVRVNPHGLVLQPAGHRTWDDGTIAESCKGYRDGTAKHAYVGATGSGAYRIQPPGYSATSVHCDMTTDGGGWTLAAWNNGEAGLANMPADFFVRQVNPGNIANRTSANSSSSINVEGLSTALGTRDVMLVSATYSSAPIIERGQGVWSYDSPDCAGVLGHSGRSAGCDNHDGNDNFESVDRFNIAIYPGNTALVPGWLNSGNELCWSGNGWCRFEFYVR
jgi:hypothetical protein